MDSSSNAGNYSFVSQFIHLNLRAEILDRLRGTRDFDDLEDAKLYSRVSHERTHAFQNVATSYGLWKTAMLRSAGAIAHMGLMIARRSMGPLSVPVIDSVPRDLDLEVLKVRYPGYVEAVVARLITNWVGLIDGPLAVSGDSWPVHFFSGVRPPESSTHPMVVTPLGLHVILGASEICEFQARCSELFVLWNTRGISPDDRDLIVSQIWSDPPSQIALRMSDNAFNVRDSASLDASLVIADLALNARFPSLKSEEDPPEPAQAWEDVHPGWRFAAVCDWIRSERVPVPAAGEGNAFCGAACHALGWEQPDKNFEAALSTFGGALGDLAIHASRALSLRDSAPEPFKRWPLQEETLGLLREFVRGPSRPAQITAAELRDCVFDAALQVLLDSQFLCPLCCSAEHRHPCPVADLVTYWTSDSHEASSRTGP